MSSLGKLSRYGAECGLFEKKYGKSLDSLRAEVAAMVETEDFALEEDLAEWELAHSSAALIRRHLKESGLSSV